MWIVHKPCKIVRLEDLTVMTLKLRSMSILNHGVVSVAPAQKKLGVSSTPSMANDGRHLPFASGSCTLEDIVNIFALFTM